MGKVRPSSSAAIHREEHPFGHRARDHRPLHGHRQRRVADGAIGSGPIRAGHPLGDHGGCHPPGYFQPGVRPLHHVYGGDRFFRVHERPARGQGSGAGSIASRSSANRLAGMGGRFCGDDLCGDRRKTPWRRRSRSDAGMGICQLCRRYFRLASSAGPSNGGWKKSPPSSSSGSLFSCWPSISSSCPGERGGRYSPGSSNLA